ncbi:metallophosphoesterase [Sphingomonas sp. PB4P5]|uniref:metallophosphoesterase n=1 Tax=Parasphingomonas puruogangriensis TaxID=3096155 RepID=UPI002FC6F576
MRFMKYLVVILLALAAFVATMAYDNARADPVVRQLRLPLADWPRGARPVRLLLASDIHIGSATMDGARLTRIVAQIDALRPDLIVLAGDFIEGNNVEEPARVAPALIEALRGLQAPLGVVAVLGNHDYSTNAPDVLRSLRAAGITVLRNQAVARGPLAIGGIDDDTGRHDNVQKTAQALAQLKGARILVAHSPDMARKLHRLQLAPASLLLAGHTHCGQIDLPFIGPPIDVVSAHYRCGVVRDPGLTTLVTAGLGTSELPIRWNVPPDLWVVTLGPAAR